MGAALVTLVLNLEICHARLDVCACADLLSREAAVVVQVVHIPLRRVVIERGVAAGAAVVYDLDIILVCRPLQQLHAPALVNKVLRVDTVHQTHGRYAVEVECRHAPPYGKVVELLEVHDNGDFTTSQMCRNGMSLTPLRTFGLSWGRVLLCGIVSSILYRDQVWLFSGHSGMGKSTHTNLWKEQFGTEIINGDLNLIGWSNSEQTNIGQSVDKPGSKGHPIVYGMPWCGTSGIASTKSYPLGGIVLLGRSDNDHFESLTNDQKIVRVMQRMISPVWTEDMLETNLKCAAKLAKEVPIYYLLCTKEPSAAYVMKARIDKEDAQQ